MQAIHAPAPRTDPPTLVVHDAADLGLAIEAARAAHCRHLRVLSAPDAACFIGPAWWRSLMRDAAERATAAGLELSDVLDCGDAAGRALEALRLGQRTLVLAPAPQWQAVSNRARAINAVVLSSRPPALDLARPGAGRILPRWLAPLPPSDDSGRTPG